MKAFIYRDEVYIRCIPAKRLFNSTTIHEVVNRGDIFAMRISDQQLTVVPGTAEVSHVELAVVGDPNKEERRSQALAILKKHTLDIFDIGLAKILIRSL